jgi:hypothetical protein
MQSIASRTRAGSMQSIASRLSWQTQWCFIASELGCHRERRVGWAVIHGWLEMETAIIAELMHRQSGRHAGTRQRRPPCAPVRVPRANAEEAHYGCRCLGFGREQVQTRFFCCLLGWSKMRCMRVRRGVSILRGAVCWGSRDVGLGCGTFKGFDEIDFAGSRSHEDRQEGGTCVGREVLHSPHQ